MLSVEIYFNDTIAKYNLFKQAAVKLLQEVRLLSPEEIHDRCKHLTEMHRELMENKEQLFTIIEFVGPGILDTGYIGDFQRALDKSVAACDALYQEIVVYRNTMSAQEQKHHHEVDFFSLIPPETPIQ